jgi:UTP--glucose-1-phosphate uridylyltransferase
LRAVIPAGGFGTRMLPATKSMPKEMLPVLDKPAIQYVVEEAAAAGCDEIVIITGRHKKAVEDHFDTAPELEAFLRSKGKQDLLERIRDPTGGARLFYVRQDEPRGLGHAVLQAEPLVRDAPFAVLLGDDIIRNARPVVAQLRDVHERTGASVIAVQRVPREEVSKYGVVATEKAEDGLVRITGIVEKPAVADAPSDLAVIGRYLFTPRILHHLANTRAGAGGEIQLTDAIQALLADEPVYCLEFEGRRFDVGSMAGWLEANVELARERGLHLDV